MVLNECSSVVEREPVRLASVMAHAIRELDDLCAGWEMSASWERAMQSKVWS
jgi:hypothetical protein